MRFFFKVLKTATVVQEQMDLMMNMEVYNTYIMCMKYMCVVVQEQMDLMMNMEVYNTYIMCMKYMCVYTCTSYSAQSVHL